MKTLLKHGTLVTMNPRREIHEGDLLIEDDRIASIMPGGSLDGTDADEVLECQGKVVIPGLVSAHSHLTGILQRGLWDETTFESWSSKSTAAERKFDPLPEEIYVAHCAACIELLRHGVTTALNMFTAPEGIPMEHVDQALRALRDTGIRGVLALSLKEKSPDNEALVPHSMKLDAWLERAREASKRVGREGARMSFMLAPSAPQRCSDRLLEECAALAAELKIGVHTHLSETKRHAEVGRRLYGEPIVRHLQRIGFLSPQLSVAHSIWLDDLEMDLLRQYNVKVVHNPSSNMKLSSGVARVKQMLKKGLTVGLGADSVNAGTVYSIFEQMKLSVLLPRSVWEPEEWVTPDQAFEMATLGGAKALLLEAVTGSIEEGKKADLVILNPSTTLLPQNKLVTQLALSESGESVESVFVNGEPVILNRAFTSLDERAVLSELSALGPKIAQAVILSS
ncbi:MAG: amidohydrolase family protein [Candidatus Binatia bacterium]